MKKFICVLLVISVLLAGCGKGNTEQPDTTQTPTETTEQVKLPERNVQMGILDGNTYTNEYVGFGIDMDANWAALPAEQLQEMPENVRDMFKGTDLEDVKFTQFTDVMAENVDQMVNFNVLYQKLGMQERLAYALMSEEQILDSVLAMSNTLVEAYANAGITVESVEKKNISFLGEDRVAMYTVASVQGIPYYILQLYYYNLGTYGITFTVGSFYEENSESVLELFYRLDK